MKRHLKKESKTAISSTKDRAFQPEGIKSRSLEEKEALTSLRNTSQHYHDLGSMGEVWGFLRARLS